MRQFVADAFDDTRAAAAGRPRPGFHLRALAGLAANAALAWLDTPRFLAERSWRRVDASWSDGSPLAGSRTSLADAATVARHALRGLLRTPAFTTASVATLALGIGAVSVVFSAVNGVLLSALPYPDVDRLMALRELGPGPARLFEMLLVEALLIACGGGAVGVVAASWGARALGTALQEWLPHPDAIALDGTVLAFACLVTAAVVARRLREMGVRMALGARPTRVVGLVVGDGMVPVIVGTAAGLAAASAATRLVASQVHGVSRLDPWSFLAAGAGFLVAAAVTCLWPAVRAARVDPVIVLRSE